MLEEPPDCQLEGRVPRIHLFPEMSGMVFEKTEETGMIYKPRKDLSYHPSQPFEILLLRELSSAQTEVSPEQTSQVRTLNFPQDSDPLDALLCEGGNWTSHLAPLLPSCETLGKLLDFSKPQ